MPQRENELTKIVTPLTERSRSCGRKTTQPRQKSYAEAAKKASVNVRLGHSFENKDGRTTVTATRSSKRESRAFGRSSSGKEKDAASTAEQRRNKSIQEQVNTQRAAMSEKLRHYHAERGEASGTPLKSEDAQNALRERVAEIQHQLQQYPFRNKTNDVSEGTSALSWERNLIPLERIRGSGKNFVPPAPTFIGKRLHDTLYKHEITQIPKSLELTIRESVESILTEEIISVTFHTLDQVQNALHRARLRIREALLKIKSQQGAEIYTLFNKKERTDLWEKIKMRMANACRAMETLAEVIMSVLLPQKDSLKYWEEFIVSELNEVIRQTWYILNIRHLAKGLSAN